MILPSDEDSRNPGDARPSGGSGEDNPAPMPWDADSPSGFDDDDEEESSDPYGDGQKVESPAPPGWREDLKEALLEAVDDLREIEDPAEDFDPPEPPDLFTFYGELVAMRNEMRRNARRQAEASRKADPGKAAEPDPDNTQPVLALIYLFDRIAAGEKKVLPLLDSAMKQAGLQRIRTKGAAFDAATMVTDGAAPAADAKVSSELEAGFLWKGQVLRPARVAIS
ncbi:MAG TPA: nucleotide exchange factor GrpE [Verrucomicrobiales bacterium]|nr:nucleotide exchange factor GrpE [Verrucomicrobiales bacterium]